MTSQIEFCGNCKHFRAIRYPAFKSPYCRLFETSLKYDGKNFDKYSSHKYEECKTSPLPVEKYKHWRDYLADLIRHEI